eukprot:10082970-Alexandrium_andersonii.AAC.1
MVMIIITSVPSCKWAQARSAELLTASSCIACSAEHGHADDAIHGGRTRESANTGNTWHNHR